MRPQRRKLDPNQRFGALVDSHRPSVDQTYQSDKFKEQVAIFESKSKWQERLGGKVLDSNIVDLPYRF